MFTDHEPAHLTLGSQEGGSSVLEALVSSMDCVKILSAEGVVRYINPSGCRALGITDPMGSAGALWLDLLPAEVHDQARDALRATAGGQQSRFMGLSYDESGVSRYWDNVLTPVFHAGGVDILCVSRDVTEREERSKRLQVTSEIDPLTRLWNRRSFLLRIERALQRTDATTALLLLDVDHFKMINDTFGHPSGDDVLLTLAERMRAAVSAAETGFVSRIGGDEFAIVLTDVVDDASVMDFAERLLRALRAPMELPDRVIVSSTSIGIACYPRDADNVRELINCADLALAKGKSASNDRVELFASEMMMATEEARRKIEEAQEIIDEDRLVLHFEPINDLDTGTPACLRTVVRWRTADGHIVGDRPDDQLRGTHRQTRILARMLRCKTLLAMRQWRMKGLTPIPVAFALERDELLRNDFAESFLADAAEHDLPPEQFIVTVAEKYLDERTAEYAGTAVTKLRAAGVRVAVAGFGSSARSFEILSEPGVDILLIDGRYFDGGDTPSPEAAAARAASVAGEVMRIAVGASALDTPQRVDAARAIGIAYGCGRAVAGAVDAETVESVIGDGEVARCAYRSSC